MLIPTSNKMMAIVLGVLEEGQSIQALYETRVKRTSSSPYGQHPREQPRTPTSPIQQPLRSRISALLSVSIKTSTYSNQRTFDTTYFKSLPDCSEFFYPALCVEDGELIRFIVFGLSHGQENCNTRSRYMQPHFWRYQYPDYQRCCVC